MALTPPWHHDAPFWLDHEPPEPVNAANDVRPTQFSLATLLGVITLVGLFLAITRAAPVEFSIQVGVTLAMCGAVIWLTVALARGGPTGSVFLATKRLMSVYLLATVAVFLLAFIGVGGAIASGLIRSLWALFSQGNR